MDTNNRRFWKRLTAIAVTAGGLYFISHTEFHAQEPPPLPVQTPAAADSFPLTILGQKVKIDPQTERDALREAIWKALPGAKPSIDIPEQLDYIIPFSPGAAPGGMTFNFENGRLTQVILSTFETGNPDVCPPISALSLWLDKEAGDSKKITRDREWKRWEHGKWTFFLHLRSEGEDPDCTMIVTRNGGGPEIEGWEPAPSSTQG